MPEPCIQAAAIARNAAAVEGLKKDMDGVREDLKELTKAVHESELNMARTLGQVIGNGVSDAIERGLAKAKRQWTPTQALLALLVPTMAALTTIAAVVRGWMQGGG
jgi:hypothetical protein